MMPPQNQLHKNVYYHDTDCGGVVYYANYLKYLEEGRTSYLQSRTIDLKHLIQQNFNFVVAHVTIDYKSPLTYQDAFTVLTTLDRIKSASLVFAQSIEHNNIICVQATVILVFVNRNFKPCAIPDTIKKLLTVSQ